VITLIVNVDVSFAINVEIHLIKILVEMETFGKIIIRLEKWLNH
jgi:hypothetical protein